MSFSNVSLCAIIGQRGRCTCNTERCGRRTFGAAQPVHRPCRTGGRDGGVPCEEHRPLPGAAGAGGHGLSGAWDQSGPQDGVGPHRRGEGPPAHQHGRSGPQPHFCPVDPPAGAGDHRPPGVPLRGLPAGLLSGAAGGAALGGGEGRDAGAGGPLPVPGRPHGAWRPASA